MLHIYYGTAGADSEKFIFDNIDPHRKTIVIVPDQFSLQAERDALRLTGRESLTELMVVDFSILGHKIVHEVEGREPEMIDRYGRHMLLTVLIEEMKEDLEAYGSAKARNSFVEHMNDMISELKRYEITPDMLEKVCGDLKAGQAEAKASRAYLTLKLEDILKIYRTYEEAIDGIYSDSEDYITYYAQRISASEIVRDSQVWIYGFDSFTPKHLAVIRELIRCADSVSVVMTGEAEGESTCRKGGTDPGEDRPRKLTINEGEGLFELTKMVSQRLMDIAGEVGSEHEIHTIDTRRETIWDRDEGRLRESIDRAITSDHHHEAERAAAYIQALIRDEGLRYGDIALVCNDTEGLGSMVTRALQRMDIPVFADRKRRVLHQPVVSFLLSFLDVIQRGYGSDGLMGMVKSGLLGWTSDQENLLENYVREFRISGSRWKEPFTYRADQYTETELEDLNEMKSFLVDACERAKDSIGRRNTASEKVRGLYDFLQGDLDIPTRIEELVLRQSEMEMLEGASETAQIWNAICGIFDQIIRVIGDRHISNQTLAEMIRAGLTSLEVGMIPVSGDCVMTGTLQRSRPGQVKAMMILGAEEGLLPLCGQEEDLLSDRELEILGEMDLELARRKAVASAEEQLAIYRICSLPTERLYVSYSQTGVGQVAARESSLFKALGRYSGRTMGDLEKDDPMERVVYPSMTISYLAQAMREKGGRDPKWEQVRSWYEENDPASLDRVNRAGRFNSRVEKLEGDMARALYMGDADSLNVSASRLEKFSSCPFAHFIQYGLNPKEQRLFEVGGREIGDVYHQCIMEYCEGLTAGEGRDDAPGWKDITREECAARIGQIMDENRADYRGGVFGSDEESRFRMERIREICADIAWAITCQIRQGRIQSMRFEEEFGKRSRLPATEFDIDGRKFRLTGKIDRMDTMGGGTQPDMAGSADMPGQIAVADGSSVRIIDYKTGANDIDKEEIRKGYQLQLAIYMDAARKSGAAEPAGIFYFKIKEFVDEVNAGEKPDPEEIEKKIQRAYRLEGIAVNDPEILRGMDGSLVAGEGYESQVIPVKYDARKGEFLKASGGELMTGEEFSHLLDESRRQAERICRQIYEGEIDPDPHRTGRNDWSGDEMTACTYCAFGSICMRG